MKQNGNRNKKENEPNVFAKAFEWYTKDRTKQNEDPETHMLGFASWLDTTYVEYTKTSAGSKTKRRNQKKNNKEPNKPSIEDILKPVDVTSTSICNTRTSEENKTKNYSKSSNRKSSYCLKNKNNEPIVDEKKTPDTKENDFSNKNNASPYLCRQDGFCCTNFATQQKHGMCLCIFLVKPISNLEGMKERNENAGTLKPNNISTQTSFLTVFVTNNGRKAVKNIDMSSQTTNDIIFMVKEFESQRPILLKISYVDKNKNKENAV